MYLMKVYAATEKWGFLCTAVERYIVGWKKQNSQNSTYIIISSVCVNIHKLDYAQKMFGSVS